MSDFVVEIKKDSTPGEVYEQVKNNPKLMGLIRAVAALDTMAQHGYEVFVASLLNPEMTRMTFNKKVLQMADEKPLPKNPFPVSFTKNAANGMKLRFVRTSVAAPLQFNVFDEVKRTMCAYVRYKSGRFTVYTPDLSEVMMEIIDESMEAWDDENFVSWAVSVIEVWYNK